MSARQKWSMSFVERHALWSDAQAKAAEAVDKTIADEGLELVRFSFVDQHGILRGKSVAAAHAAATMRNGCTATTTLLAKDTACRPVFAVLWAGGGLAMAERQGGADMLLIGDPTTFRILPWADKTGWMLCDIYFPDGKPVPFSTRRLYRDQLARLAAAGFDYVAGLEVEFHLYRLENSRLSPDETSWPAEPPEVSLISQGFQLLTETRFDLI